jgi:hypothetical protein
MPPREVKMAVEALSKIMALEDGNVDRWCSPTPESEAQDFFKPLGYRPAEIDMIVKAYHRKYPKE